VFLPFLDQEARHPCGPCLATALSPPAWTNVRAGQTTLHERPSRSAPESAQMRFKVGTTTSRPSAGGLTSGARLPGSGERDGPYADNATPPRNPAAAGSRPFVTVRIRNRGPDQRSRFYAAERSRGVTRRSGRGRPPGRATPTTDLQRRARITVAGGLAVIAGRIAGLPGFLEKEWVVWLSRCLP